MEIHPEISEHFYGQSENGRGLWQPSARTLLLSRRGQDICIPSFRNAAGNTTESLFRADEERLCSRRNRAPKGYTGTRPQDTYSNASTISEECGSWHNASNEKPQYLKGNGRKVKESQGPNKVCDDGILGLQEAESTGNTGATEMQVSKIALQTDSCDTLYVNKDTLVAYTIAVVQNTQSLQYEQMQIALQTTQNQVSIETPLKADTVDDCTF